MYLIQFPLFLLFFLGISSCNSKGADKGQLERESSTPSSEEFKNYWYQGKAEISSYELEQARYGQIRKGEQILLFVTEDQSKTQHQKLNNPKAHPEDAVKVMKMNRTKKFTTGIYPYSMMNSVFTPVHISQKENTYRSTTSSQEWCGHTFTLIDRWENELEVQLHSYFISEGDTSFQLKRAYLEDAIYNRIRIAPEKLPTGSINIIPGSFFQRFKHTLIRIEKAEAKLSKGEQFNTYEIIYQNLDREIEITFEKSFPYRIEKVEETYTDGDQELTSIATRKATIVNDYWNRNSLQDTVLRKKLLLD